MSYYSSKQPGLFLYIGLVIISVLSFLFIDMSAMHVGILAILWGTFTALRALSLYEMSEHYEAYADNSNVSKNNNAQSSALAYDLMHRMNAGRNMKRGMLALYCLNDRTILWFTVALLYTAFYLHISTPVLTKNALMETMCVMFMIGATFWAGQSYAYSTKISRMMIGLFTALFTLSVVNLQSGMSYGLLAQTLSEATFLDINSPQAILVVLALYSIAVMLYALVQQNKSIGNIVFGLGLVLMLAAFHIMLEPTRASAALWMSGWGLFSVFWIRAYGTQEKRYVIYQCV